MLDKKKFYVNGEWVDPINQNNYEVINPSTEETCAIINLGSSEDTNSAVGAARKAFDTWKDTSKDERVKLLEKLLEIYKSKWDDMTNAISTELGCPKDWCSANQTSSGAGHIEDFIKRLKNFKTLKDENIDKERGFKEILNSPVFRNFVVSEDSKTTGIIVNIKQKQKPQFSAFDNKQEIEIYKDTLKKERHQNIIEIREVINSFENIGKIHFLWVVL